jgi:NTP pyrophosphatase (non-canonical NTP hydrolase)
MSAANDERVAALADRLRAVEEELGDVIYDVLRQAVSRGEAKRPDLEKRLTRARNAVGKAVHLLDDTGAPAEET